MVTKPYVARLFGVSPIRPLEQHMDVVLSGVKHLVPLFKGVIEEDSDAVAKAAKAIIDGEHKADELKKGLRHHLPKSLFMPIDRRDLLDVLLMQDSIANQAKDIASLITGRKMTLPKEMHELFAAYGERSIDAVEQADHIINELDKLVEAGFGRLEVDHVEDMITKLDRIESDTDKQQRQLRDILFTLEDTLRPTDVMFTYRLIEWVGNVADAAQKVGSRLQLTLAR
jgi:predicted phosphate transport protein (TIGR00153 family)